MASQRRQGRRDRFVARNATYRARDTSCGKHRYTDRAVADAAAILKTSNFPHQYPAPLRAYYCYRCGGYHLTHQPRVL